MAVSDYTTAVKTLDPLNGGSQQATPKHQLSTKLDRAIDKKKAKADDEKELAKWSLAVKERDKWRDRKTGKKVKRLTIAIDPDSAHAHHIEPRENQDTRYDTRNGITLSALTHDAVERNNIQIIGTKFFTVNGRRYIDSTYPVTFKEIS